MSWSASEPAAAVERARRDLVGLSATLLDLQADTGQPGSQEALDCAVERLAARLLWAADRLPTASSASTDAR